jgi:lipopolysaccharide export system protein LptC
MNHKAFYGYIMAFAVVSFLWAELMKQNVNTTSRTAASHSADYFSVGYEKWQMDENGRLDTLLNAQKMTHYSDNKTIILENPVMTVDNSPATPWKIRSQTGEMPANSNLILLHGAVFVTRAGNATARELAIETSNLTVMPQTHFAQTNEWTQLRSGNNVTTGLGMKATFNAPIHLELLAKVHGKYETK